MAAMALAAGEEKKKAQPAAPALFNADVDPLTISPYICTEQQPLDMEKRFGRPTGSIIAKIIGKCPYDSREKGVLSIFQAGDMDTVKASEMTPEQKTSRALMDSGHEHEPLIANWYARELKKTEPDHHVFFAKFRTHKDLPWIGTSVDRLVCDSNYKILYPVEIKYVAGRMNKEPPNVSPKAIAKWDSQCQLHCFVYDAPHCDLVVGTSVGNAMVRIPRRPDWWASHKLTHIIPTYDLYLRWYWEPSEDKKQQAIMERALRELLTVSGSRVDQKALFARRPPADILLQMRRLRERTNKADAERERKEKQGPFGKLKTKMQKARKIIEIE